MEKLIRIIQENYDVSQIEDIEKNDPMFKALEYLYLNLQNKEMFLPLVLANSLVCYQLSSNGESYWEEFSREAGKCEFKKLKDIYMFFIDFLPKSEGNKRLVKTKIERLKKLDYFLSDFFFKQKFYYKNMDKLRHDVATAMMQLENAKTIVFSVKMFGYGARIRFADFIPFPKDIPIPIDSRLKLIYKNIEKEWCESIDGFYSKVAEELNIAPLHLDAILWLNHKFLIGEVLDGLEQDIEYGYDEA